jgi:hypothetical protein
MDIRSKPLSETKAKPAEWLWKPRIPLAAVTVLEGDPEANKSTILNSIAARVSAGEPMPLQPGKQPFSGEPQHVVMCSPEHGSGELGDRFYPFGKADLRYLHSLPPDDQPAAKAMEFPRDSEKLKKEVKRLGAKLVILDPISGLNSTNLNNDQGAREFMHSLKSIADDTGAAIIIVRHLSKGSQRSSLQQGAGSMSITAAARSQLQLVKHPIDPDARFLIHTKGGRGGKAPILKINIRRQGNHILPEWTPELEQDFTEQDIKTLETLQNRPAQCEAVEFLIDQLSTNSGYASDIMKAAEEAGISNATLRRAKEALKIKAIREDGHPNSPWVWPQPPASSKELMRSIRDARQREEEKRRPRTPVERYRGRRRRRIIKGNELSVKPEIG